MYKLIDAYFTAVNQETESDKWLELRRSGIGGSDAGAIMGLNKYASPLTIYMQKKGIEGFSGNAATEWGHILEDPIRQKAAKELDIEIQTVPGMFRSKEYSFMNANLDGLIYIPETNILCLDGHEVNGLGGHEIKTSSRGEGFSDNEIPDSYFCQVQHYMAVTNLDWFVLTVFFLNTKKGKHYLIKRNDEFIEKLIECETDFWENHVMVDKIPAPSGLDSENEYLKNLPIDSIIQLDAETENLIAEELNIDSQIKELQQKQSALKASIILKLNENSTGADESDKITATVGNFKVTYNKQIRKSVDTEAIKAAGLFEQYSKESECRVMRISQVNK